MATDTDPNIVIETSGLTASVATDVALFGGSTAHFQVIKLAYGPTGSADVVSSGNPLPVSIATGLTATITGFSGPMSIQGIVSGTPVPVSGTVTAIGISGSPMFVKTFSGSQVEVTGGRYLSKSNDSVSVWGPSGITYIYTNIVDSNMNSVGVCGGALRVSIVDAGFTATINVSTTVGVTNDSATSALRVQGFSGGTSLNVTVGNTVGINDTNILLGITGIYAQVVGLRSDLGGFAVIRPTGGTAYRLTSTTTAALFAGFTCKSGINIKASSTNTDIIYISDSSVVSSTSSLGYELDPGESLFVDIINMNLLTHRAKSSTQIISYIAT